MFSEVKGNSLMFFDSKFAYLPTECLECNCSYCDETDRHLKVRSGEHIGILTFRKVKPPKESTIRDHLLNCNNILSFYEFTILAYEHHKFIFEIKESFLIKRDRPALNKKISSAKLVFFLTITRTFNNFVIP